jgi:hypothetical protein
MGDSFYAQGLYEDAHHTPQPKEDDRVTIAGNNIDVMAKAIHDISTEKGFAPPSLENLPEKLMLSVSELAEALEEHRSLRPDEEVLVYFDGEKPEGILVEIGDSVIRNLHMMHSLLLAADLPLSISDILNMKVNFNAGRPAKHGRNY